MSFEPAFETFAAAFSKGIGQCLTARLVADLETPVSAFMKLKDPIEFVAPDGESVSILIFLLVPEKATQQHLEILSSIAQLLSDSDAREKLISATDPTLVCELLQHWGNTK